MFGKLRELLGIAPQAQPIRQHAPTPNIQFEQPRYEDDVMDESVQGYAPQSNDIAHMRGNMQTQAYPVQRLYGGMAGVPSDRRRGIYLQSGGVPMMRRNNGPLGVAEDANGQDALRRMVTQNLMVR